MGVAVFLAKSKWPMVLRLEIKQSNLNNNIIIMIIMTFSFVPVLLLEICFLGLCCFPKCIIDIHIFYLADSQLSRHFTQVPMSLENSGTTEPLLKLDLTCSMHFLISVVCMILTVLVCHIS